MKAALLVVVPPAVVSPTSAGPAAWGGVVAVTWVEDTTLTFVAADPPKLTPLVPVRLVPVIVTIVPPAVLPDVGSIPLIVGVAGVGAT